MVRARCKLVVTLALVVLLLFVVFLLWAVLGKILAVAIAIALIMLPLWIYQLIRHPELRREWKYILREMPKLWREFWQDLKEDADKIIEGICDRICGKRQ